VRIRVLAAKGGEFSPLRAIEGMTDYEDRVASPAVELLCEQLYDIGGSLSQIVAHMHASQAARAPRPDDRPIPDVLKQLLAGTLAPLGERYGTSDVETAAAILDDAGRILCEEIFLVPIDAPLPRNRRRRRHRARRR
jgi:hypothetical protein